MTGHSPRLIRYLDLDVANTPGVKWTSGLGFLHLLLGELVLLWFTEQLGDGDLNGLGGLLLGCHWWRSKERASLDWDLPGDLDMISVLSIRVWHSCSAALPSSLRRSCNGSSAS